MPTKLTERNAAVVKAMLQRGDKMHDIAAYFSVNPGRIAEIKHQHKFQTVEAADIDTLPAPSTRAFAPELDPEAPLDQQIATLRLLVMTTPSHSPMHLHRISPRLADWILKNLNLGIGNHNRHFRPAKIKQILHDIDRGWWTVTGAPIIFGSFTEEEVDRGMGLLDGQNRLSAFAQSNKPVPTYIVFGIDPHAFTRIDTGAGRTGGDTFIIYGIPNAGAIAGATRWLKIFETLQPPAAPNRGLSLTNDELWDNYKRVNQKRLQQAVQSAKQARRKILPLASLAALFYIFVGRDEECAKLFIHDLEKDQRGARFVISQSLHLKDARLSRVHENEYVAKVVLAWNEYRAGNAQRMRARALDWDVTQPFPVIT